VLALALGGRTVAELQACMSQVEFLAWIEFYRCYPFDDFHRYYRPAALISQSLAGGDMRAQLNWLQPDPANAEMNEADMNTLQAFGFKRKAGQ
jgi:hypothetical protein